MGKNFVAHSVSAYCGNIFWPIQHAAEIFRGQLDSGQQFLCLMPTCCFQRVGIEKLSCGASPMDREIFPWHAEWAVNNFLWKFVWTRSPLVIDNDRSLKNFLMATESSLIYFQCPLSTPQKISMPPYFWINAISPTQSHNDRSHSPWRKFPYMTNLPQNKISFGR